MTSKTNFDKVRPYVREEDCRKPQGYNKLRYANAKRDELADNLHAVAQAEPRDPATTSQASNAACSSTGKRTGGDQGGRLSRKRLRTVLGEVEDQYSSTPAGARGSPAKKGRRSTLQRVGDSTQVMLSDLLSRLSF
ncbi:uncharacterized protein LOC144165038 [Haemaphysalis longicornis]